MSESKFVSRSGDLWLLREIKLRLPTRSADPGRGIDMYCVCIGCMGSKTEKTESNFKNRQKLTAMVRLVSASPALPLPGGEDTPAAGAVPGGAADVKLSPAATPPSPPPRPLKKKILICKKKCHHSREYRVYRNEIENNRG